MDQRSFVESLFDTGCEPLPHHGESPSTPQSQFPNEFAGLNDIPIPEDVHIHGQGSHTPIDLDDINVPEAEHEDEDQQLNIPDARGKRKAKKQAKCWDHFKLISTGKVVDGLAESKAVNTANKDWHGKKELVPLISTATTNHVQPDMDFFQLVKHNYNLAVQASVLQLHSYPRGCIRRTRLEPEW
jgi:predicted HAD superfamily phosphohydrolase